MSCAAGFAPEGKHLMRAPVYAAIIRAFQVGR